MESLYIEGASPETMQHEGSARGCFVAVAAVVLALAGMGAAIYLKSQADYRQFERKQAAFRAEFVKKIKAGDNGDGIFVFVDSQLIEMLFSDPDCVANLTTLSVSCVAASK